MKKSFSSKVSWKLYERNKDQETLFFYLIESIIDFLPSVGPTKNMNNVFRLKRFVNMAFRHCPVVLRHTKYTPSVNILSHSKHWIYEHTIGAAA